MLLERRLTGLNRGSLLLVVGLLSGCGAPEPSKLPKEPHDPQAEVAALPVGTPTSDASTRAELKVQADHFYAEFRRVRVPCGAASRDVEQALRRTQQHFDSALAEMAEKGQQACRDTFLDFGALPIPVAANAALGDRYDAVIDHCMQSAKVNEGALFRVATGATSGDLQNQKDAALSGMSEAHLNAQSCSRELQALVMASGGAGRVAR